MKTNLFDDLSRALNPKVEPKDALPVHTDEDLLTKAHAICKVGKEIDSRLEDIWANLSHLSPTDAINEIARRLADIRVYRASQAALCTEVNVELKNRIEAAGRIA